MSDKQTELEAMRDKLRTVYGEINNNQLDQLESEFLQRAVNFLYETETTIAIDFAYQGIPEWSRDDKDAKPVNIYRVKLSNKNHTYEFNFYSSLHDTHGPGPRRSESKLSYEKRVERHNVEQRRKIRIYDVLACLCIDYSEDFEDFCIECGYDTDSRKALATYETVRHETKNLKRLWPTESEQSKLHEIS